MCIDTVHTRDIDSARTRAWMAKNTTSPLVVEPVVTLIVMLKVVR
jgi:hypothetical protein